MTHTLVHETRRIAERARTTWDASSAKQRTHRLRIQGLYATLGEDAVHLTWGKLQGRVLSS